MINYYEEVSIDIAPVSHHLHGICLCNLGYSMGGELRMDIAGFLHFNKFFIFISDIS